MTRTSPNVLIRSLATDPASISATAQTISLSFAPDPLIQWLMQDQAKPGWESLDPALQKWQELRMLDNACRGIAIEAVTDEVTPRQVGACFLFPPKPFRRWFKPAWWAVLFRVLYKKYVLNPTETLSNAEKIRVMYEAHSAAASELRASYPPNTLYYLEIAAVHPDSQSLGVGGKLMRAINKHLGDSPCFLECTNVKNVPFYEKYGFQMIQERELKLANGDDSCILYYMVRDPMANAVTSGSERKSSVVDRVASM